LQLEIQKLQLEIAALRHQGDLSEMIKSWITPLAAIVAGAWVLWRLILAKEMFPNIEFTADINVVGRQEGFHVVELIAFIENKGKAQHRMNSFEFDLSALYLGELVACEERWGGQVNFPHEISRGSFLPKQRKFFFVDPGTKAKYSYIARVPVEATFLVLHCNFRYTRRRKQGHTAEKTVWLRPPEPDTRRREEIAR
jgi:hypothetical protein